MRAQNFKGPLAAIISCGIFCLSMTTAAVNNNCSANPSDPNGSGSGLESAIQQASNTGRALRITGTYYISSPIQVYIRKNITIDARGARFVATSQLDGDMFSLDAHSSLSDTCGNRGLANVSWRGGEFNIARAKVSRVVPIRHLTPAGREGTKNTADALSIRGVRPNDRNKLNEVTIEGIKVIGTLSSNDKYYEAGGDSGILLVGGLRASIRDNEFYGIRDAAIYVSAAGSQGQFGDHFTLSNNIVERAYDGITSKRGADNIKMLDNRLKDVVVGLSTKKIYAGWTATNVTMRGNRIDKSVRGILIQRANNAIVENNTIINHGAIVAGSSRATNPRGNKYEAITFDGVQGQSRAANNILRAVGGSRKNASTTHGIVSRRYDGRNTVGVSKFGNSFDRFDRNVVNID